MFCTCEYDLIWKQDLSRCNRVQMRLSEIRVSPKSSDWCPQKKREFEHRNSWKGNHQCDNISRNWNNAATSQRIPRIAGTTINQEVVIEYILPQSFWKEPVLPTFCFGTLHLLKYERIHFCCFKSPSLWQFVTAALEN